MCCLQCNCGMQSAHITNSYSSSHLLLQHLVVVQVSVLLVHCAAERKTSVRFLAAELTAADFQGIGDILTLPFAGAWAHCHGDVASFIATPGAIPHFPAGVPACQRPTYWKLKRACGATDLLISSLDGLLSSVVCCLHGSRAVTDPACWLSALQTCSKVCCENDLGRTQFLQTFSSFLHDSTPSEWQTRPANLARPLLLSDYQVLGRHFGLCYRGAASANASPVSNTVPVTAFSLSAVFEPVDAVRGLREPLQQPPATCTTTSYFRLYMTWQNRVPTFARMRQILDCITTGGTSSQVFEQAGRKHTGLKHSSFRSLGR